MAPFLLDPEILDAALVSKKSIPDRKKSSPPPAEFYTKPENGAAYAVLPLPNKGLSVLSTRRIQANTPLLTAAPLLLIRSATGCSPDGSPELIISAFRLLPAAQKTAYLRLCDGLEEKTGRRHTEEERILGVWKCNNFCLDAEGTVNAVFDLPSRLNHACIGGENCCWTWDDGEEEIGFVVEREVDEGVELTHCYRPDWRMGTAARREALLGVYGFWCRCEVCEGVESD
jgi:hypothetical protein